MIGGDTPPAQGVFWWTLRWQWRCLLGGAVIGVIWRALMFALPVALGRAIDNGVIGGDVQLGLVWVAIAFLLALTRAGAAALRHWVADIGYYQTLIGFRQWILDHVQALDLRWHAGHQRGEVLSRVNADPRFLATFVGSFPTFASAAVTLVGVSLTLVLTSPSLALIAFATVPLVGLTATVIAPAVRRRAIAVQQSTATMTGTLEETLAGIVVVKSLGAEDTRMAALSRDSDSVRAGAAALERMEAALTASSRMIPASAIAAGLWVGGHEVAQGTLTLGELVAFTTWMAMFTTLIETLMTCVGGLMRAVAASQRIEEVLATPMRPMGARTDLPGDLTLVVEQVSVRPPGHSPILEDVSLVIQPGERVAVTGATGSGKSTLLSLLPGLIEPTAGRVTLGGVDVREFDPVTLRSTVASVPEDALLFEDSVRANLTLGCPEARDEDLWEALRLAEVANLVAALPRGLESLLGRGGREVSGGEAQRLCLARALVRNPAILVLDDALSAVDEPTERRIVRNLEQWPGTLVFTTNRPVMLALATRRLRVAERRVRDDLSLEAAGLDVAGLKPVRDLEEVGDFQAEPGEEPARSSSGLTSGTVVQGALRRAWPMIRPFATAAGLSAVLSILGTVCVLLGPRIIKRVVDNGILGGETSLLAPLALLYLALAVGAALFHFGFVALSAAVGESALHTVRLRTWSSLHRQPLAFFEAGRTGELVSRATDDIQELASFFRNSFETVVTAGILLALGLVFMFLMSPWLTLAALALVPISIAALSWYLRHSPEMYAAQLQANAETVNAINQTIGGVAAIHATGDFRYGPARARQADVAYLASSRRVIHFENRAFFPVEFVNGAVLGCVVAAGIGLTQAGITTTGLVVAFIVYVDALIQPLTLIADLLGETQKARVALARLLGIQELPGEAEPPDIPLPLPARGTLEVHAAAFGYRSGRPVLRGVNLRMQPGTRVTIVGPSGVGKSTLAKLLSGLERPSSGSVALGGIDLLAASPADRRRAVTLISQGSQLFDGTIADNLRLARPEASDEDMWDAARRLGLHTMFERFPDGLETPVGRQGTLLSAGERQLVALVRLALHDPAVIVLDESTSRVDDAMEREIHACLERLAADRALIVIAHRPSTISRSDQVLTLRNGQLAPLDAVNV